MASFDRKRVKRKDMQLGKVYALDNCRFVWVNYMQWVEGYLNISGPTIYTGDRMSWFKRGMIVIPSEKAYKIEELDDTSIEYFKTVFETVSEFNN